MYPRNFYKLLCVLGFVSFFFLLFFDACKPQAEEMIDVKVPILRFDKDFFETKSSTHQLNTLLQKNYQDFYNDFLENILGIIIIPGDTNSHFKEIERFKKEYQPFFDSTQLHYPNLTNLESQFSEGFTNLKKYYPAYKIPKLVAFVGPIDATFQSWYGVTPDFINDSTLGISLLLHLGNSFKLKGKLIFEDLFEEYILKKFTPETIVPNCFKNIVEDIYPDKSSAQNLISQIVEKGKKIYFVKQCLPTLSDTLLFGYSTQQIESCNNGESLIWKLLLQNNTLYSKDPQIIRNFIGEAPFTNGLPRNFPGFLGLWMGYQIVEQYMQKNKNLSLKKLMAMDNETLFKKAGYKPPKSFD